MLSQAKENHPKIILFHRISFLGCINLQYNRNDGKQTRACQKTLSKHVIVWLLVWFMAPEQEGMV